MISLEKIIQEISNIADEYSLKRVDLFGSLANNKATEKSDIDLLIEFNQPNISLIILSSLKLQLEELLDKDVDIIHGPLSPDSLIKIDNKICIYKR